MKVNMKFHNLRKKNNKLKREKRHQKKKKKYESTILLLDSITQFCFILYFWNSFGLVISSRKSFLARVGI